MPKAVTIGGIFAPHQRKKLLCGGDHDFAERSEAQRQVERARNLQEGGKVVVGRGCLDQGACSLQRMLAVAISVIET